MRLRITPIDTEFVRGVHSTTGYAYEVPMSRVSKNALKDLATCGYAYINAYANTRLY